MQLTVTQVRGIDLQTNSFTTPDGSFQRAINVTFGRDNLLHKRRGFSLLSDSTLAIAANTLIPYGNNLLLAYNQGLGLVNTTTGVLTTIAGSVLVNSGAKIRYSTANANLYMATAGGVRKAVNATAAIVDAGLPSALDLTATAQTLTGFLRNTQVGYRITFSRKDVNNNVLQSAPSELSTVINNPLQIGAAYTATLTTVTITTSVAHGYTGAVDVYLEAGDARVPTATNGGTRYTATVASTTTFTIALAGIVTSGTVTITPVCATSLDFSLPAGLVATDTVRIYRSTQSATVGVAPDLNTLGLIAEVNIIPGVSQTFADAVSDDFHGAFLYTNPNQENTTQANSPPPFCADIALFKNYLFFANTSTQYVTEVDLINTQVTSLAIGQAIHVHNSADSRATTAVALVSGTTYRYTVASSGLLLAGQYIHVEGCTNAANNGNFLVTAIATKTVDVTNAAGVAETCPAGTLVYPTRRYVAAATENFTQTYGGDFQLTASVNSVFTPVTNTARSLVRAINRDVLGTIYCQYISTPPKVTGVVDVPPGQMLFSSRSTATSYFLTASNTATGTSFSPAVPTSGIARKGSNDVRTNRLFYSKDSQPEHVPAFNFLDVGPRTNVIQRIVALRDSLIIIGTAGLYRLVGNTARDFTLWALDLTVSCTAPDSVVPLNNLVFMLSTQGVVTISDTSVQVVSRQIEPLLSAIFSSPTLATETDAIAYEAERLYILSTLLPNSTTKAQVYVYNTGTNAWSTWTTTFSSGVTGPDNKLYLIRASGDVEQERKNNNKLDFCDRLYATTVNTVAADGLSCTITPPTAVTPVPGDAIVSGSVISRVLAVTGSVVPFTVTFAFPCNLVAAGSATLYRGITTEVFTNPLTGGDPSKIKHFTQFQAHFRTKSCSNAQVSFASNNTLETPKVTWATNTQIDLGFGYGNWGLSGWGNQEGINSVYETEPSQILRVDIPVDAQRSTYLQARIIHNRAAEPFEMQAVATTARPLSERTTR